jgi:hypothetical protein
MAQEEHATMFQGQGFLSLKREGGREGEKPGRRSSRYGRPAFPWFGHKGTCRSEVVYKNKSKGSTRMDSLQKNMFCMLIYYYYYSQRNMMGMMGISVVESLFQAGISTVY